MAGSGFAVTVKLIDFATGPLGKVNSAIANVEKTAKKAAREGGLFEARDALKKMRDEAGEVAEKLGQVFSPLGGLTAAGSLAGLVGLAERFARTGNEVSRTANLYGVAAKDLQNWRGAMRLAGGEASDATALIGNVGRQLYLARAGLNPTVARGAAQFGLDITKPDLQFVLDAADKLKGLSAQQRRQFAEVFGIDEGSLALLSLGSRRIEELIDVSRRHGYLNDKQLLQAAELHFAYTGLTQSVESMGSAIGAQVGTWLTPMLTKWSEWLDKARETPAVMKNVELGVDALAAVLGVTAVGAIAKLLEKLLAFNVAWATSPLGKMLGWVGFAFAFADAAKSLQTSPDSFGSPSLDKLYRKHRGGDDGSAGEYGVGQQPGSRGRDYNGVTVPIPGKQGAASGGYSLGQMKTLARNAGFKGQDADMMAALAMVESSGNPNARGKAGELGLTQINPNAWGNDLAQQALDPQRAFEIAHDVYGKQGWTAWKNSIPGAQAYLNRGNIPAEPVPEGGKPGTVGQFFSRLFGIGSANAAPMMVPPAAAEGRGTANFAKQHIGMFGDPRTPGWADQNLATVTAPSGAAFRVHKLAAASFQGFVNELEASGYRIDPKQSGGYNLREMRGGRSLSEHAFGNAIDINSGHNLYSRDGNLVTDLPANVSDMAAKYGLTWGGDWKSLKDAMHFEWTGAQPDKAQPYGPPVATAADTMGKAADAESGDTSHHVQVTFANAPPGMRSGLTRADGPASVSVRKQYAMDGVY